MRLGRGAERDIICGDVHVCHVCYVTSKRTYHQSLVSFLTY
jgi:hypothetical protein